MPISCELIPKHDLTPDQYKALAAQIDSLFVDLRACDHRALRDMDEKDWVTSSWDLDETQGPPRRVYCLTAQGDEVLGSYMQDLRETHAQIGDLMDAYSRHMEEGQGEHH